MAGDPFYVVGAGAIGGVIGAYLARGGLDVVLVDRERAHVEAIDAHGLRISGFRGDHRFAVPAIHPDDLPPTLRRVILAVKAQHTDAALAPIAPRLAPDGWVLSAQNGLCEEAIAAAVGAERTIGCFVHFGADYQEPGHVLLANEAPMYLGELDGAFTPRLREAAGALSLVVPTVQTDNVFGYLWAKLVYGVLAFAAALVDQPFGEVLGRPSDRDLYVAVAREVTAVARAHGVRLERFGGFEPARVDEDDAAASAVVGGLAAASSGGLKAYTGIQRDLMVRKRPTEVDHQPGVIRAKGRAVGIATPWCDAIQDLIHEVEAGARPLGWANLEDLRDRAGASRVGA
jgi:2-dehydropantoate 2-reductase